MHPCSERCHSWLGFNSSTGLGSWQAWFLHKSATQRDHNIYWTVSVNRYMCLIPKLLLSLFIDTVADSRKGPPPRSCYPACILRHCRFGPGASGMYSAWVRDCRQQRARWYLFLISEVPTQALPLPLHSLTFNWAHVQSVWGRAKGR